MNNLTDKKLKNWDSQWGSLFKSRVNNRDEYPAGPAAGPGILAKYHQYYDQATQGIKEPSVLVLGSTPELRDYALSQGAKLSILDQNEEVMKNMTSIMKYKDSKNEKKVIGNWLEMPFENNNFDLVWGDGITNNVLFKEHSKLFTEIVRILKSNGHLLLRDDFIDPKEDKLSIMDSIEWAHKNKMHKYDLFFKLYAYSTDGHIDHEKHLIDMAIIADKMEKDIYGKGILTEDEEKMLKEFMTGTVKSTFVTRDMWLENFKQYFDLIEVGIVDDYYFCKYFNFLFASPR
ncbi:class I SAM-dependent methyltransferase [bacterium]|nr:class I SAM-dependent methyltransferase [bacterium]